MKKHFHFSLPTLVTLNLILIAIIVALPIIGIHLNAAKVTHTTFKIENQSNTNSIDTNSQTLSKKLTHPSPQAIPLNIPDKLVKKQSLRLSPSHKSSAITPVLQHYNVKLYFFRFTSQDKLGIPFHFQSLSKDIVSSQSLDHQIFQTLIQLVQGPSDVQILQNYKSYIPENTQVLSVEVSSSIAIVDLSKQFLHNNDGDPGLLSALQQIVYTCTQWPSIKKVSFVFEGNSLPYANVHSQVPLNVLMNRHFPLFHSS